MSNDKLTWNEVWADMPGMKLTRWHLPHSVAASSGDELRTDFINGKYELWRAGQMIESGDMLRNDIPHPHASSN